MKPNYTDEVINALIAKSLAHQLEEFDEEPAAEVYKNIPEPPSDSELLGQLPETLSHLKSRQQSIALTQALPVTAILAMNRENEDGEFDEATEEELEKARTAALKRLEDRTDEEKQE